MEGVSSSLVGNFCESGGHNSSHGYILPRVLSLLDDLQPALQLDIEKRLFEVGCGNGGVASALTSNGCGVMGVDPSGQGIQHARALYLGINLRQRLAYDALADQYGFSLWY